MAKTVTAKKQKDIKDFLKAHGHKNVDALDLTDEDKTKKTILALHGMDEQYRVQG